MKTVGISLALGDIYSNEKGLHTINIPLDGGIERFRALTAEIPRYAASLITCTAGYSKNEPLKAQPERRRSLADQLRIYVRLNEFFWREKLIARPLCWSTRSEIRIGIKLARRTGFVREDEEATLLIASNLSHLLRILLYALMYKPKHWKLRLIRAHHSFPLRSHALEVWKTLRDIPYAVEVWGRLRGLREIRRRKACVMTAQAA